MRDWTWPFRLSNRAVLSLVVDPPQRIVLALKNFWCNSLFGGRASWKMGGSAELEGGGVGALVEVLETREEAGQAGEEAG